jgi:hypothetical protein
MLSLIASFVVLWLGVHRAFVAVMHARARRAELTVYWKINLWPLAAIAFVLDVAFNVTFGTLMYLELPRECLFTTRCKRHFRGEEGWRQRLAVFWQKQLNILDPGHID